MKAYIKDINNINGQTKAFINVMSGTIREDRLTTANSSFDVDSVPTNINIGDIFILLDNKAKILYYGKITSLKDNEINCSQIISVFDGTFIYSIVDELKTSNPSTYLEEEIAKVINHYKSGAMYESTYTDTLISQQIGSLVVNYESSIENQLPSDKNDKDEEKYTSKDMVRWLYELYETYGIVVDITIPIQAGTGAVKIWKPNYSGLKITDGFECISAINPTTEQQSTNRIIMYWNSTKDGHTAKEYRETDVLTINGIVKEPTSIVGRMNTIKTKIVFSDDPIDDVIKANLNEELFNHKIEFDVDIYSKIFNIDDLKLDVPVQVYSGTEYFNSLITAREYEIDYYGVTSLKVICGKVRNSLTNKIGMGLIK